MKLTGCSALITGASAGIGREMARQLAGRAAVLVLVARRQDRLEKLIAELTQSAPNLAVHLYPADLREQNAIPSLVSALAENGITIDLLINNAGVGDHGRFATAETERLDSMLDLNIAALTNLTRALLPAMIERKRGGILNVSSSASFMPMPKLGVYAATKAYVTSFSEALRAEVHPHGISVSALCPGPVDTEFNERAQRSEKDGELGPSFAYVAVEEVARAGLAGIETNKAIVIPGLVMKLAMLIVRLTPMPLLRLALRAGV